MSRVPLEPVDGPSEGSSLCRRLFLSAAEPNGQDEIGVGVVTLGLVPELPCPPFQFRPCGLRSHCPSPCSRLPRSAISTKYAALKFPQEYTELLCHSNSGIMDAN